MRTLANHVVAVNTRVLGICLAAFVAGCGIAQPATSTTSTPPTSVAASGSAGPTALPTPGPGQFANPVIDQDFPDPDTLKVGDTYYVYATNTDAVNIQTAQSRDLVHWTLLSDALPVLPAWSRRGLTWAPEVTTITDGTRYVMYFVAHDTASNTQCIGLAISAKPEGPFTSTAPKPLICQINQGGSIDPSAFTDDDGTRYVLWKNDGNCCGKDTWVYIQKTSADGSTLEGQPVQLIKQDQTWEGKLIEAPTLWKHSGKYYLFYSANDYAGASYAIGYATADTPRGPYHKPAGPLLATSTDRGPVLGPGGQDIVTAPSGKTWLVYHSWEPRLIAYRSMSIDELTWNGDRPVVKGMYRVAEIAP